MMIFYEYKTGNIVGYIEGRIHRMEHLQMWIGDPKKTGRLVINWDLIENIWKPDHKQEALIVAIEKNPATIYEYTVKNDMLVKK